MCGKSLFDNAGVAKLVDALDLGSSAARRGGSSPSTRTFLPGKLPEKKGVYPRKQLYANTFIHVISCLSATCFQ